MTLLELLNKTTEFFEKRQLASARLQAESITAHVLNQPRLSLYLQFDRPMQDAELNALRPLVRRRADGEPLQHIIGHTEFFGLQLACSPDALIPRPETEGLVERVIASLENKPPGRLLDVGTGTGAIALACAKALPEWKVHAVEPSAGALALARRNAECFPDIHVEWHEGEFMGDSLPCPDAVVANLPYLTPVEMESLSPEVRHDPESALHGGEDGLDLIRQLIRCFPMKVGHCFLEIGIQQGEKVHQLLAEAGFSRIAIEEDWNGCVRYAIGTRH